MLSEGDKKIIQSAIEITKTDYEVETNADYLLNIIEDLVYEYEMLQERCTSLEEELEDYASKPRNYYAELGLKESDFC